MGDPTREALLAIFDEHFDAGNYSDGFSDPEGAADAVLALIAALSTTPAPDHADTCPKRTIGWCNCGAQQIINATAMDFAREFIHVRGAHNPTADELEGDQEVRPCAFCRLAGEQAVEALSRIGAPRE